MAGLVMQGRGLTGADTCSRPRQPGASVSADQLALHATGHHPSSLQRGMSRVASPCLSSDLHSQDLALHSSSLLQFWLLLLRWQAVPQADSGCEGELHAVDRPK